MKTLSRIVLMSALVISTGAAAQLSATFTVQRNFIVPPSGASYSNVNASCPAGYAALSGGLDNDFGSRDIEITTLAPTFGASGLLVQPDGTGGAPDGWYASVINHGTFSHVVMALAVCAPIPGVVTIIGSAGVSAGTNTAAGTGSVAVSCPSGYIATGGGIDVSRPEAMKVISTSPFFSTGNPYIADRPSGTHPAPAGWFGLTSNEGSASGTLKVAAVCATLAGVVTQILSPIAIAPNQHDGVGFVCPAGYMAIGGGLDSVDPHALVATVSTPAYNGFTFAANRDSGDYPAPAGWFADAFSHSSGGNKDLFVALVCAPIAAAPPGSAVIVYEFYNTNLKHYFRTANAAEATAIDGGSAGPGWVRTDDNFTAYAPGINAPGSDVCRFYYRGANSHFYTADAAECQGLRALNPANNADAGWRFEEFSFRIQQPITSGCPSGTIPVHRLYNNRFAFNDSNHRFTTNFANVPALQALGWLYEGVAFCALNFSGG